MTKFWRRAQGTRILPSVFSAISDMKHAWVSYRPPFFFSERKGGRSIDPARLSGTQLAKSMPNQFRGNEACAVPCSKSERNGGNRTCVNCFVGSVTLNVRPTHNNIFDPFRSFVWFDKVTPWNDPESIYWYQSHFSSSGDGCLVRVPAIGWSEALKMIFMD